MRHRHQAKYHHRTCAKYQLVFLCHRPDDSSSWWPVGTILAARPAVKQSSWRTEFALYSMACGSINVIYQYKPCPEPSIIMLSKEAPKCLRALLFRYSCRWSGNIHGIALKETEMGE